MLLAFSAGISHFCSSEVKQQIYETIKRSFACAPSSSSCFGAFNMRENAQLLLRDFGIHFGVVLFVHKLMHLCTEIIYTNKPLFLLCTAHRRNGMQWNCCFLSWKVSRRNFTFLSFAWKKNFSSIKNKCQNFRLSWFNHGWSWSDLIDQVHTTQVHNWPDFSEKKAFENKNRRTPIDNVKCQ